MKKLIPIGDHIIVEPIDELKQKQESSILIPESVMQEKPVLGTIIASGTEGLNEGDMIIFSKYGPNEVAIDEKELLILKVDDIYAKVE